MRASNFHHHGLKIRLGNHATAEVLDNFGVSLRKRKKLFPSPHQTSLDVERHVAVASRPLSLVAVGLCSLARYGCCQNNPSIGVPVKSRALSGIGFALLSFRCQVGYQSQPWRSIGAGATLPCALQISLSLEDQAGRCAC